MTQFEDSMACNFPHLLALSEFDQCLDMKNVQYTKRITEISLSASTHEKTRLDGGPNRLLSAIEQPPTGYP
ncbi:hypothetical protein GCM10007907_07930 [Chitinimonas prasina]|uniref:Uncharacterized protein n=1 Tax=Chitinimonas prasina TaxID=1434937 RepID=A0ABQ5YDD1_9NEIS|nr:hypothetical protein GCM10007907_07930 [Chitinimonas prasina]